MLCASSGKDLFYSRKDFLEPYQQDFPHCSFADEVCMQYRQSYSYVLSSVYYLPEFVRFLIHHHRITFFTMVCIVCFKLYMLIRSLECYRYPKTGH